MYFGRHSFDSKSSLCSDLAKLVIIKPAQDGKQMDVSTFVLFMHSNISNLQNGAWIKHFTWRAQRYKMQNDKYIFISQSHVERHASTSLQQSIPMDPCCTNVMRFLILTCPDLFIQSQIGLSDINLFKIIQVVISFSNKFNWLWNIFFFSIILCIIKDKDIYQLYSRR